MQRILKMDKYDLIKSLNLHFCGDNYKKSLDLYVDIVEHYIFMGNIEKAKQLLVKLGFEKKNSNNFIKETINRYNDDYSEYLKMIMNNKVKRKTLN